MKRGRLSAGVIPVRFRDGEAQLLLLRAYRNWDFPKGEVEAGEAPLNAAQREMYEETGLNDLQFRWGEGFRETARYGRGKTARYYLAETSGEGAYLPVNEQLGRPEHHEFRWVTARRAAQLLPDRLQPILQWALVQLAAGQPSQPRP